MDLLRPDVVAAVRRRVRFVVGQVATELPPGRGSDSYHLIVSSIPALVDQFRTDGADAQWLPLAFEPSLVERIGPVEQGCYRFFVGSLRPRYADRVAVGGGCREYRSASRLDD